MEKVAGVELPPRWELERDPIHSIAEWGSTLANVGPDRTHHDVQLVEDDGHRLRLEVRSALLSMGSSSSAADLTIRRWSIASPWVRVDCDQSASVRFDLSGGSVDL